MNNKSMPICAEVKLTWRDHERNYEPKSTVRIFRAKTLDDLQLIIKGYANHYGITQTEILRHKDLNDEEKPQQQKVSPVRPKATRKKSRKKR